MARKSRATARIVPVPAKNRHGYRWSWRTLDGAAASERLFDLFFDCLDDARKHGYEVELPPLPPEALRM